MDYLTFFLPYWTCAKAIQKSVNMLQLIMTPLRNRSLVRVVFTGGLLPSSLHNHNDSRSTYLQFTACQHGPVQSRTFIIETSYIGLLSATRGVAPCWAVEGMTVTRRAGFPRQNRRLRRSPLFPGSPCPVFTIGLL